MKKATLFFIATLALGSAAFANSTCPLKNLLKSQTMHADGTAYYPKQANFKNSGKSLNLEGVQVGK